MSVSELCFSMLLTITLLLTKGFCIKLCDLHRGKLFNSHNYSLTPVLWLSVLEKFDFREQFSKHRTLLWED